MFLLQQVSVFPLIVLMAFIRIWVSTTWVWFCEGLSCQFLAKKGENKGFDVKGFVNQEFPFPEELQRCQKECRIPAIVAMS